MRTKQAIIVHGYIRNIERLLKQRRAEQIIPLGIIQICYQYYMSRIKFFVANNSNIIEIDIDKQHIKHISDIFRVWNSNVCYIPDLSISCLPLLKNTINNSKLYDGFMVRQSGVHYLNLFEEHKFIRFASNLHISQFSNDFCNVNWSRYDEYIYCGAKNGIIASTNSGLYQLKLQNIRKNGFAFKKINDEWKLNYHMHNMNSSTEVHSFMSVEDSYGNNLSLCNISQHNKMFAIENKTCSVKHLCTADAISDTGLETAKCGIFDFDTDKWKFIESYKYNAYRKDDSVQFGLCYDGYKQFVYLVSTQEKLSRYNLCKNKWEYIFGLNEIISAGDAQIFDSKPIVWLDSNQSNVIWYAVPCEYDDTKIDIKYYDLRSHTQRWTVGHVDFTRLLMKKLKQLNKNQAWGFNSYRNHVFK
eukprot:215657_1